jgi:hypothetical protein
MRLNSKSAPDRRRRTPLPPAPTGRHQPRVALAAARTPGQEPHDNADRHRDQPDDHKRLDRGDEPARHADDQPDGENRANNCPDDPAHETSMRPARRRHATVYANGRSVTGCRAACPASSGPVGYPCTDAAPLTSLSPLAAPDPAVTRPAEFAWMILASRRSLGAGTHTGLRIANIFQDLLLSGITGCHLMRQTGRRLLSGQPGSGRARLAGRNGPGPAN